MGNARDRPLGIMENCPSPLSEGLPFRVDQLARPRRPGLTRSAKYEPSTIAVNAMIATTAKGNSGTEEVGVVWTEDVVGMLVEVTSDVVMPVRWEEDVAGEVLVVEVEVTGWLEVDVGEDVVDVVTAVLDHVKVVNPKITGP